MSFYEIEFPLPDLDSEAVEAALLAAGALSITLVDGGDQAILEPKPGEIRLWNDTRLRALFDAATEPAYVLRQLASQLGPQAADGARVQVVADRAWERVWLADWEPMRFGPRLWVIAAAHRPPDDPDAVVVRLDPGLAFGTGSHPTTALCLEMLASLPLAGRSVIDYGCGSGILGIAALKLGAASVTAVDVDHQALLATRDNAARNAVDDRIQVQDALAALTPAFCVCANILAGPLIELAPRLRAACGSGGYLLLSGLLVSQAGAVLAAYADGFVKVRRVERDDWCCICVHAMF